MRDPERIPIILSELQRIWEAFPDLRLGQLIMDFGAENQGLYYIEDDYLINRMKSNIYNMLKETYKENGET